MSKKASAMPKESIYAVSLRLLDASSRVFASLISLSAAAYLMGWIAARSYLVQFDAGWLASQLSPIEIFSHALTPLYYFLIAVYLVLKDMDDDDWPKINRWEEE
jgi:hypothetical protein